MTSTKATSSTPPSSPVLCTEHLFHLREEGFTSEQIDYLVELGVASISAEEAKRRGFKVWDASDRDWVSSAGIYFPFSPSFGQVRCDRPLSRGDGEKPAKYITPVKAKSEAYLPEGCEVVTEGFKDALAGSLHGQIPTGALAGVSHYRKALEAGSKYTILFDADGWHNPQVFSNLITAGKYLHGKVQLLPEIPGQPKAGLCEYFKAGHTATDYEKLIASAKKPEALLMEWPLHWRWSDWNAEKQLQAVKTALGLAAAHLDHLQQGQLIQAIQKASGLKTSDLDKTLEHRKNLLAKQQSRAKRVTREKALGIKRDRTLEEEIPEGWTGEKFIYHTVFEAGCGKWTVMDGAYYEYREAGGYWRRADDTVIQGLISKKLEKSYRTTGKGKNDRRSYPFATDKSIKAAFQFNRTILEAVDRPHNNHLRAFSNCTVDLRTGESMPHGKNYFLTSAIAAPYEPNQPCPEVYQQFLLDSYGEELIPVIRAVTSMLLDPTAPYGKFVHLIGNSGTGKGVQLRLWQELFGIDHSKGGSSFSEFATAEQRHQNLTGCSLYVLGDVGGYIKDLRAFYDLVDNAPMGGRPLFSSTAYQKKWDVRFAIASVAPLQVENSGDGWGRRVIPIPTLPSKRSPDSELGTRLAAVKGQIISWALAMPRQLRDAILMNPAAYSERIAAVMHEQSIYGDSVMAFVDACLRPSEDASEEVPAWLLHEWYKAYCREHGYQAKAMNGFLGHLKTLIPNCYLARHKVNGRMIPPRWVGLDSLAGVFSSSNEMGDRSNGYQGIQSINPVIECRKEKCREGGIDAFNTLSTGSLLKSELLERAIGSQLGINTPDPLNPTKNQGFQDSGSVPDREDRDQKIDLQVSQKNQEEILKEVSNLKNGPDPTDPSRSALGKLTENQGFEPPNSGSGVFIPIEGSEKPKTDRDPVVDSVSELEGYLNLLAQENRYLGCDDWETYEDLMADYPDPEVRKAAFKRLPSIEKRRLKQLKKDYLAAKEGEKSRA